MHMSWLSCEHLSVAGCIFYIDFYCACRFDSCDVSTCHCLAVFMGERVAGTMGFLMQHAFKVSRFQCVGNEGESRS